MKNVFTSVTAVLLVIWYSLSVIGFDVHTCSDSGESFVTTVIGGTTCEDIHPEHDKEVCACCHHGYGAHHDSESETPEVSTKPCCTDDWQMIALTGCKVIQEQDDFAASSVGMCPLLGDAYADNIHSHIVFSGLRAFSKPGHGAIVSRDFQQTYGVWRI